MTAPRFVPTDPRTRSKHYVSPPGAPRRFSGGRPGELTNGQPRGARLGVQGPDQGYVKLLADRFRGQLTLEADESEADALAGASHVALKRASLFGRAPVVHDMRLALTLWGFLGDAPRELIAERKPRFAELAHSHDPIAHFAVVDGVPDDLLRRTPKEAVALWNQDWRPTVLSFDA